MKRTISLLLTIILTMCFCTAGCSAENNEPNTSAEAFELTMQIGNPNMTVNKAETEIDPGRGTVPVIQNDRTLVPIRAIIEAMGGTVDWEQETNTAILNYKGDTIKLTIGSTTAYFNETASTLDVAPIVLNERTMLPIRYIAESFKFVTKWNGETQTVTINKYAGTNEFDFEKRTVLLNNGIEMPIIGIGTFTLTQEQAENSVYHALVDGYRLIDTAAAYNNEEGVGRGIARSNVPREEIFVTTKLWPSNYNMEGIDACLERLGLEYIDLMLLHQPMGDYIGGYKAMEQAVKEGKIKSIGLSNFTQKQFDEILEIAEILPAVNQVENHIYHQQNEMIDYLDKTGTVIESWFPFGGRGHTGEHFADPVIVEIAEAHKKTSAQIILRWHLQAGHIAIPGSSNPDHILENISIFDFELTDEEMAKINGLNKNEPYWQGFGTQEEEDDAADRWGLDTKNEESKDLVVYFSMPETDNPDNMTTEEDNSVVVIDGKVLGNTQYMAFVIQETLKADIFRIEPKTPYPTDHKTLVDLAADEQENNARPELLSKIENLDKYDTIYIGYPNWWGDLPMIMYSFFEQHDFSGKTIIPFNTHGGSGFSDTINTIKNLEKDATVLDGLSISRNHIEDAESEIIEWVNSIKK